MFDLFAGVTAAIRSLIKVLRLRQPGMVFLVLTREIDSMLEFKLILPAPSAPDVVERRLSLQIGSQPPLTPVLMADEEAPLYSGTEGDLVSGSLVDVDDAGNVSPPRDFEFTLRDTIAPPQPGEIGIEVVREYFEGQDEEEPADPVDPVDEEE